MNIRIIILSERSQSHPLQKKKREFSIILFIQLLKCELIYRNRKQVSVCLRMEVGGRAGRGEKEEIQRHMRKFWRMMDVLIILIVVMVSVSGLIKLCTLNICSYCMSIITPQSWGGREAVAHVLC